MKRNIYTDWSKEELIREIAALKKQKTYGLVWDRERTKESFDFFINWDAEKAKEEFSEESKNKFPVLKEIKEKAIAKDSSAQTNLLIEGDNYHSLAVLSFTHKGAIDVIYIDPPYNTGNNDFKYNDKFVDKEDGYRHSKWLSFMSKRLLLSRMLLKNTGIIFISIDDNEQAPLRLLLDDIFGEKNFVAQLIWRKKYGGGKGTRFFVDLHEYVLCYAKDIGTLEKFALPRTEEQKQIFELEDEFVKERGRYYIRPLKSGLAYRKNLIYPIRCPDGSEVKTQWICSKETFEELLSEGRIVFKKLKTGSYNVYKKFYENDKGGEVQPDSILYDIAYNQDGKEDIKRIFGISEGREVPFANAKPVKLIKYLLSIGAKKKNSLVLDFFAGSGTTGQAVLELNKEDGGKRKFILCTNDENKICTDICYPRLERVIKGYKNLKGERIAPLGENLRYYRTDFVDAAPTDKNKRKLVDKCTEMLCIKENAFEEVKEGTRFKIFKNNNVNLGIIFDDEYIEDFVKAAQKIDGQFNVYVFSHDDSVPTKEFKAIRDRVTLCPIPETILKVYRKVFAND